MNSTLQASNEEEPGFHCSGTVAEDIFRSLQSSGFVVFRADF